MRIGSLFSGIGGLELGLEAALDAHTIWQVERDEYARQVLERHWPSTARDVHDIREAGAHNLAHVDIIAGGFPCQGLSVAGQGKGLEDERSGLWFEMLRVIRELRPPVVILENVPAIRTRGLDVVLGGLASLGYDAEWGVFGAADVGAPHRRQRWYCIAYLPNASGVGSAIELGRSEPGTIKALTEGHVQGGAVANTAGIRREEGPHGEPGSGHPVRQQECPQGWNAETRLANTTSMRRTQTPGRHQPSETRTTTTSVVNPAGTRLGEQRRPGSAQAELATTERTGAGSQHDRLAQPRMGRADYGFQGWAYTGEDVEAWEQGVSRVVATGTLPNRVDRLRCLGNAVVPMWAYWVGLKAKQLIGERRLCIL